MNNENEHESLDHLVVELALVLMTFNSAVEFSTMIDFNTVTLLANDLHVPIVR